MSQVPLVPRPNPRGRLEVDEVDERIADLQYRDVMEFAVGHGVSATATIVERSCQKVETCWMPSAEVERVEPASLDDVELGMDALATLESGSAVREALAGLVGQYRRWLKDQKQRAPQEGGQREVSDDLLSRAAFAADRIEKGLALLDDSFTFKAFRLANRTMAMAARQRRAMEQSIDPSAVTAPKWRPFQLAFVLMNLRSIVEGRQPGTAIGTTRRPSLEVGLETHRSGVPTGRCR